MSWEHTSITLNGKGGETLTYRFRYTGPGFIKLVNGLPQVKTSCSCTVADWNAASKILTVKMRLGHNRVRVHPRAQSRGPNQAPLPPVDQTPKPKTVTKHAYPIFNEGGVEKNYNLDLVAIVT